MIILVSLIIFTLISFAFGLGVVVGKTFFQLPKTQESTFTEDMAEVVAREVTDSLFDFQRDFIDFERN